jgi:hypothetical protein
MFGRDTKKAAELEREWQAALAELKARVQTLNEKEAILGAVCRALEVPEAQPSLALAAVHRLKFRVTQAGQANRILAESMKAKAPPPAQFPQGA